MFVFGRLP